MTPFFETGNHVLGQIGVNPEYSIIVSALLSFVINLLIAGVLYFIVRQLMWWILPPLIAKTKSQWDDIFLKNSLFRGLAHFVPAIYLLITSNYMNESVLWFHFIVVSCIKIYFVGIVVFVLSAILNSIHDIYNTFPFAKDRPIKGYIQLIKIIIYVACGIVVLSIFLLDNPLDILKGMGALAAVFMLVFKDTLLGFVAGVQLTVNKMVKLGDWIQMPTHMADGTVEDISLTTVKVQNWDKTITTVPTYALVSQSMKNWKGMEQSGGRRIKRNITIDMESIQFCDDKLLTELKTIDYVNDYLEEKYRNEAPLDESRNTVLADGRVKGDSFTNIGLFRHYLQVYLHRHPQVNDEMTFVVRQLQPTEFGLPIEIYVFCKEKSWSVYEEVQSGIFDHVFAMVPKFKLKLYQYPSGFNLKKQVEEYHCNSELF